MASEGSAGAQAQHAQQQVVRRAEGLIDKIRKRSPAASQIFGLAALLATAGASVVVGGIAAVCIAITLLLLTPVFLFFSPILVPAALLLFLCVGGVLAVSGTGVTVVSVAAWIYNQFMKGGRGTGAVDVARRKAGEAAEQAKLKARELGGAAASSAQQAVGGREQPPQQAAPPPPKGAAPSA